MSFPSGVSGGTAAERAFWYLLMQGNVSGSKRSGSFCGNQNVRLKFLYQDGCQFRLHYVSGPTDTVGSRIHMAQA